MTIVRIVNVIATANLNQRLNLENLAMSGHVVHDEATYGGRVGYFRSDTIRGTVSLFSSGKMISMGARSKEEAIQQLEVARDSLVEDGFISRASLRPIIQNIVATVNFEHGIDLEGLAREFEMDYEPEQFPGAIFKLDIPYEATIIFYSSGKTIIVGVKNPRQIEVVLNRLEGMIALYLD